MEKCSEALDKTEKKNTLFPNAMLYSDYLSLGHILNAQHPLSPCHDEMLFIIQHQVSELWIKLLIHELDGASHAISVDNTNVALKILGRIGRIFEQLLHAWSVLATLTPSDYIKIRPFLLSASGLQSHQYRILEFMLGNKNPKNLNLHAHLPRIHKDLELYLKKPSFYDEIIRLLARQGFAIDEARISEVSLSCTQPNPSVEKAWHTIYNAPQTYWDLYTLAEKLMDLEDNFRQWRFRHMTTVARIIGFKKGTGGTSGVHYLQKKLEVILFPELWNLRTTL
jgi:tryptophan 2,3-dioxygenase